MKKTSFGSVVSLFIFSAMIALLAGCATCDDDGKCEAGCQKACCTRGLAK